MIIINAVSYFCIMEMASSSKHFTLSLQTNGAGGAFGILYRSLEGKTSI